MKNFLFLVAVLFFASCTARMGDLTQISTRNIDKSTTYSEIARNVKGKDTKLSSILFFPLPTSPNLEVALNNTTAKVPGGEYVKNANLSKQWRWYLLWSTTAFIVEGDVWGEEGKATFKTDDVVNVKITEGVLKSKKIVSGKIVKIEGDKATVKYSINGNEKISAFKLADCFKTTTN